MSASPPRDSQREPTDRPGLRRAVVALQHRDFRYLWLASLVSAMGGQIQSTANLWQIFLLTGSPLHIGLTGLARAVPIIAFSLVGGVVADRVNRRKIIMSTQAASGALSVVLALLSVTGLIDVWHIYAVSFLGGAFMSVSSPARSAVTASLVPRHHLMNAFALNGITWQTSRIVAPSLAGVLIASLGLPFTYLVNGLAHLATFVSLGLINLGPLPVKPRGNMFQNLVEGLAFIRFRSIILILLATDTAAMLFGSFTPLLPIVADRLETGAMGFGVLIAAEGVGAIIGAAAVMAVGDIRYKGFLIVGSILAYCACLAGLALVPWFLFPRFDPEGTWVVLQLGNVVLSPWFLLTLVVTTLLGLTDSLQATPRNALIQLITPEELRGRVSSFQQMLTAGTPSVGQGIMGASGALLGPPLALVAGAAACAAANIGLLLSRWDLRAADLGGVSSPPERVPVGLAR